MTTEGPPAPVFLDVIPEFRLPEEACCAVFKSLGEMGAEFVAGEMPRPEELLSGGFDAVYTAAVRRNGTPYYSGR